MLPVVMGIVLLELFYRNVENDYFKKAKDVTTRYDNTEVLIFGNSQPFYGLNPDFIEYKTYNFSLISETLYYDKLLFDKHINKFSNLKCVVFHIEYTTLAELVETKENNWRKYYYKHYMDVSIPNNSVFDSRNYLISFTRGLKPNIQILNKYFKEGTIVNTKNNGFGTNYSNYDSQRLTPLKIKKRAFAIEDHLIDFTKNITILNDIIKVCQEKNIKVVFLTLPNTKSFYEFLNPKKVEKMVTVLENLENENKHVTYYNWIQHPSFNDFDFYDADHLNHQGAKKASQELNESLKKLLK